MSIHELFAGLRSSPQAIDITAGRDTIIFAAKGTMLHFYPDSFKDILGGRAVSGTVRLTISEMYSAGEMIAQRATTMRGRELLQSGGQIRISASIGGYGGEVLRYGIGLRHESPAAPAMQLFMGTQDNKYLVVNWLAPDTAVMGGPAAIYRDTTGAAATAYGRPWAGYLFNLNADLSLYTGCGALYKTDSPMVRVSAILPDGTFSPANTQMYLVLPSINAVISSISHRNAMEVYDTLHHTITLIAHGDEQIVPAGMAYKLVMIARKDGQYYYYEQAGTVPHSGLTATAALAPASEAGIKEKLGVL